MTQPTSDWPVLDAGSQSAAATQSGEVAPELAEGVETPQVPGAPGQAATPDSAGATVSRRVLGVALAATSLLLAMIGLPGPGICWLALAVTALVAVAITGPAGEPGRLPVVGMWPGAYAITVATSATLAVTWNSLGLPAWNNPVSGSAAGALLVGAALAACVGRRGRVHLIAGHGWVAVTGAFVGGISVYLFVAQSWRTWARSPLGGTDFPRHLAAIRQVQADGLSYAGNGYPRGPHSFLALLGARGELSSVRDLWLGAQSVMWLTFTLMVVGTCVVVLGILRAAGRTRWWQVGLGCLFLVLAVLQGAWIVSTWAFGQFATAFIGMTLATGMTVGLDGRSRAARALAVGIAGACVVCVAHSWQLLAAPACALYLVAALAAVRAGVRWWRLLVLSLIVAAFSVPPMWSVVSPVFGLGGGAVPGGTIESTIGTGGWAGLLLPGPQWFVGLWAAGITVGCVFTARRTWALSWIAQVIAAAATFVLAWGLLDFAGPNIPYYPLKVMWSISLFVLPVAIAGSIWAVSAAWQATGGLRSRAGRLGLQVAIVTGCVVVLAAVGVREVTRPPDARLMFSGSLGRPALALAVADYLSSAGIEVAGRDAVVWGLTPYLSAQTPRDKMALYVGITDQQGLIATQLLGARNTAGAEAASLAFNEAGMCQVLAAHPDALRITGPNPATGAAWLRTSGCPEAVVKSDQWIAVPIGRDWLTGLGVEQLPGYLYPPYRHPGAASGEIPAGPAPTGGTVSGLVSGPPNQYTPQDISGEPR